MKVGLYSITCSGTWYRDRPAMTLEEFIDFAGDVGYDGVEIDLKRPHGSPLDLDAKRCKEIRSYIDAKGLELPGVAANNNFASPVPEQRENELLMVREQIRVAKDLGAPVLRLFAAWPGITYKNGLATYEETRDNYAWYGALDYEKKENVVTCLKECVKWAEDAGIVLALQNHRPVIERYQDMLDFVEWVDSPWLKCSFDAPNVVRSKAMQSDTYISNAVRTVGDKQVICHCSAEFDEDKNGNACLVLEDTRLETVVNYPAYIKTLKEVGYKGYINYEYCHIPFRFGKIQGFDYVEKQVRLALRYLRGLIDS